MSQFPKQYGCDRRLHNSFNSDAVSLGMFADNFKLTDHWHAFMSPFGIAEPIWSCCRGVSPFEQNCGPTAVHQNASCPAFTANGSAPHFSKINDQRSSKSVIPSRQQKLTDAFINGVLQCLGVIRLSVACRSKVACLSHRFNSPEVSCQRSVLRTKRGCSSLIVADGSQPKPEAPVTEHSLLSLRLQSSLAVTSKKKSQRIVVTCKRFSIR